MKINAWIAHNNFDYQPVGNGKQWQYPIFSTLKEAEQFIKEPHGVNCISKCEIIIKAK